MPKVKDLTGRKFGRLEILERAPNKSGIHEAMWKCKCDCGKKVNAVGGQLRSGRTKSCGCLRNEQIKKGLNYKHGQSGTVGYRKGHLAPTVQWRMWYSAKRRAAEKSIPFTLKLTDIPEIPKTCPILGIPLFVSQGTVGKNGCGRKGRKDNSPALDKIIPRNGYVVGNIQVISQRANQIKSDATAEELYKVYKSMLPVEVGEQVGREG